MTLLVVLTREAFSAVALSFLVARITRFAAPLTILAAACIVGETAFKGSPDDFSFKERFVPPLTGIFSVFVAGDFFRAMGSFFPATDPDLAGVFLFLDFISKAWGNWPLRELKLSPPSIVAQIIFAVAK